MVIASSDEQGEYFDELEVMPTEARQKYLNQSLRRAVHHAYHNAAAVKDMFDHAQVKPGEIRTVRDLEKLPITRKADLMELQQARPPYGGFLAISPEEIDRVFISPGPVYEPLHTPAIKWFAKAFYAAGFRTGDVVINTFTYHMSPAGILFHEALRDCGATVVVTGTGNTDVQVQTMRDLRVSGFVGTPSFLMTVIKRAEEMGYDVRRDLALRRAWFTGEMLPDGLRRTLEGDYHIATAQAYAVTEPGGAIAYECRQKTGMHLMDEYVVEIVDPSTGRQLGAGETGEVVVTPTHNEIWGLIRFGTGDLSSYSAEPCPCGRTANRLVAIIGRTGDAVKVRGMFIVARQAEQVVHGFEEVSQFQMVIGRRQQRDELTLRIGLRDGTIDRQRLAERMGERFRSLCRVAVDRFEFVESGGIPCDHPRIVDTRVWA
jgi:phenylacetate-CoA ligase